MSHLRKIRKVARRFLHKGWAVVPVPLEEKAPRIKSWQKLRMKGSEIDDHFSADSNIGVLTGAPSGGLTDVDLDCPEAIELGTAFLPYTGRVHGRKSKPKSHRWYAVDPILAPEKFCDPDGTCLLELRSTGQQTVVPPSIHPSGERIEWDIRKPPAKVNGSELRTAASRLAAATLFTRHWPSRGSRNAGALSLAGTLLRAGWDEFEAGDFVGTVARAAGDEEWIFRKIAARATRKRLDKDATATGRPKLAELMGVAVVDRACGWLGLNTVSDRSFPRLRRPQIPWPEALGEEAFYGLAGDIVRTIAPETEADPAGLLLQFLTGFGNLTGRHAYFQVGATRHYTNLYVGLVGQTSRSRKGTSWNEVFRLLSDVDPEWARDRKVPGGLSTGEGLIWAIRDAPEEAPEPPRAVAGEIDDSDDIFAGKSGKRKKVEDQGVDDKRLLVVEPEFASTLRVMRREASTLSAVIRTAWDSGDLNNLTKNSAARATDAHVSIITHITQDELRRELTATDTANGFANRFLWDCVRRARLLPFGGHVDPSALKKLAGRLRVAAALAQRPIRIRRTKHARRLWKESYPSLTAEVPGLLGAVTSRAEAQVIRLAMIYALLDCSRFIRSHHLSAALAVWRYCYDSARYIFGDALGDPIADTILRELRRRPNGLTRTEIREIVFKRNRSEEEISRVLGFLLEGGWVSCTEEQTGGRPAERWIATR
jgi:hypothetical protein